MSNIKVTQYQSVHEVSREQFDRVGGVAEKLKLNDERPYWRKIFQLGSLELIVYTYEAPAQPIDEDPAVTELVKALRGCYAEITANGQRLAQMKRPFILGVQELLLKHGYVAEKLGMKKEVSGG